MTNQVSEHSLNEIVVPLNGDARHSWSRHYGIQNIYLNDIAAGVLIEVPHNWTEEEAVDLVSEGLRHLVQELWREELIRPVLAVFWGVSDEHPLGRLTWDQDQHRGDFALRKASSRSEAEELLWALMGDTMGALDESLREDKVDIDQVAMEFEKLTNENEPSQRLTNSILEELRRARKGTTSPDLVQALNTWLRAEERLS